MQLTKVLTICAELVKNWKAIKDYLTKIAATQVMQGVKNKVILQYSARLDFEPSWSFVLLHHHAPSSHPFLSGGFPFQPRSLEWVIIQDEFFTIKLEFLRLLFRDC